MSVRIPQRILVAPSGFKESMSAERVAESIACGVRRSVPGVVVDIAPIADGGEGTAATLVGATGGRLHPLVVTGPTGDPVSAHWAELGGRRRSAVVEMASAAGLSLVPLDRRDPGQTTTYGVGELIAAALDAGMESIVVGCGDSGTCDGGAGALQALGVQILDAEGREVGRGGNELVHAVALDFSRLHPRIGDVDISLACNPHNVLCGPRGVARVFGAQKGATGEDIDRLDAALTQWADLLDEHLLKRSVSGVDLRTGMGTGASGGLGAGLIAGVGATARSRFDVLLDADLTGVDIDRRIAKADLVITAEGSIDFQTPHGKVPAEIARRAAIHGVPVVALAGSLGRGAPDVHDVGIAAVASILTVPMPLSEAVAAGEKLLADAAERMMRMILLGAAVSARSTRKRSKKRRSAVATSPVAG